MAYDLYNFPYSRTYDGDLGYLIQVYNELLEAYKNANLDYSGIQSELDTVKDNLEKQITKEDADYTELRGKIENIEAYLGTGTGTLQETLTKIQNDIVTINGTLRAYDTRITNNTNVSNKNTSDISALKTKTDTTNSDLDKLTGRVSANENAIAKNTRDIQTESDRISSLENTLAISYLQFTPSLSGARFNNLNFHLYRIGNTLHFALSTSTTISESDFVTLDSNKGLNYNYGLKLGEFDSTVFNDTFSNNDFITFGSCTISSHLGTVTDPSDETKFYFTVPMCFVNFENLTTIYALLPTGANIILISNDLSIVCNGSAYMKLNTN